MFDAMERIVAARDVESAWQALTPALAAHGFDRAMFGMTRFRTERSFGDLQDCLILSNHGARYTDRFIGEAMYRHAPMLNWALTHEGACSWRWVHDHADTLSDKARAVIAFNASMGVVAGYTISFPHTSHRIRSAIALTAPQGVSQETVDRMWESCGREVSAVCHLAHLKILSLPQVSRRRRLTPRQREVLEWVGDGKTMQDTATILGLTCATVEKHLRLAREALEVETTAQAVLKATVLNQIFLVDPA